MSDAPSVLHDSAQTTLDALHAQFPGTPFLALGQTALWDEPTKASLRFALDRLWPDARLIAAAHDTDYFAKLPGHAAPAGHPKYAVVLHDDAKTRGLWSAAGEMSRLFGSEDVPAQSALEKQGGVSLHRALDGNDDPLFLLSELTAAWGWTGIIYTHWDKKIVRDVPLSDILHTLLEQIDWAMQGSIESLNHPARVENASKVADIIRGWITSFARTRPDASLSDLYRDLFPRLYGLLLGGPPANLSTSSTSRLLSFNRETAPLPRFAFVDLFLNPITRRIALDAYNLAVGGTDTYTLDRFGDGAIPFDLVIPGKGRGTICIPGDGTIYVDTPQPITLCDTGCDFASVEKLADLIERELGPDVVLVGKAVTLLPMLAAEFVIVFHEGASGYTDRTQRMLARLTDRKISLPALRPILRLKYATWDALAAAASAASDREADTLSLPEHLAQAVGRDTISPDDFAACWRRAVLWEENRLKELASFGSPRDLLGYLARQNNGAGWGATVKEYEAASLRLLSLRAQAQGIQGRIYTLLDQMKAVKKDADQIERAKGDDFRARVQPLRERLAVAPAEQSAGIEAQINVLQTERAAQFDMEIASRRSQVRFAQETVRELREKRLAIERGAEATSARATLRRIESEAERARARRARNALQTIGGLPHTDYRPSAWWFPLVDASGAWFRRLCETTEFRLEPLLPDAAAVH